MPDTPTFGRYAEIPYDQMTPEQQEGYRSLNITRRWSGGIRNRGLPNDNGREARPDLLVLFARRNEAGEQDSA